MFGGLCRAWEPELLLLLGVGALVELVRCGEARYMAFARKRNNGRQWNRSNCPIVLTATTVGRQLVNDTAIERTELGRVQWLRANARGAAGDGRTYSNPAGVSAGRHMTVL